MIRRGLVVAAWLLLAAAAGCSRREEPAPPAAPTLAQDRASLDGIVSADVAIEKLLKQADDLTAHGSDDEAIAVLEKQALPAIDLAITQARNAAIAGSWGIARRDEWVALFADRRIETVRYAAAIRSGELEGRIAAMQAQAALTRRAMAVAKAVQAGPP